MIFSIYAKRFSSLWINQVKAIIALSAFFVAMLMTNKIVSVSYGEIGILLLSGFCRDVFTMLPMEFAMEADKLLALKLEGTVG
jgi:hypothetical protein